MKITFKNNITKVVAVSAVALSMTSCFKDPDSAGYEYMPDMYRSPAVEAYVDYGIYDGKEHKELTVLSSVRKPAAGTIPFNENNAEAFYNMPYAYPETTDGYEAAGRELSNPLVYSKANIEKGEHLYTNNCVHCHGATGAGDGKVVTIGGHAAPGAYDGALKELPVGKIFHTLTYGKGMMGPHSSQLSKKERWQVAMHVQKLQNGGEKYPAEAIMSMPTLDSNAIEGALAPALTLDGINFNFASASINMSTSRLALNKLLSYMNYYDAKNIRVEGHTDNIGTVEANISFSKKRAKAVKGWLVSKGVNEARIQSTGFGPNVPVASNESDEGRAANRRTEVRVLN